MNHENIYRQIPACNPLDGLTAAERQTAVRRNDLRFLLAFFLGAALAVMGMARDGCAWCVLGLTACVIWATLELCFPEIRLDRAKRHALARRYYLLGLSHKGDYLDRRPMSLSLARQRVQTQAVNRLDKSWSIVSADAADAIIGQSDSVTLQDGDQYWGSDKRWTDVPPGWFGLGADACPGRFFRRPHRPHKANS